MVSWAFAVAAGTWHPCWSFIAPDACWELTVSTWTFHLLLHACHFSSKLDLSQGDKPKHTTPNKAPSPWNKCGSCVRGDSPLPALYYQRLPGSPYLLQNRKIPLVERKSMNVSGTRCICKQNFGSHRVSFLNFILEMGVLVSLDISERVSKVPKKESLGEGKGRDGGTCSESRVGNNSRSPLR